VAAGASAAISEKQLPTSSNTKTLRFMNNVLSLNLLPDISHMTSGLRPARAAFLDFLSSEKVIRHFKQRRWDVTGVGSNPCH
jgi:hypothetical protein